MKFAITAMLNYMAYVLRAVRHVASPWGEWVGPDPSLLFRPLLKSVLYMGGGGGPMYVYCNFLLLTIKEKLFRLTLFWVARLHCCTL